MSGDASIIMSTVASPPIDVNIGQRTLLGTILPMFENGYRSVKRPILVKPKIPITDPSVVISDQVAFSDRPDLVIFSSTVYAGRQDTLQFIHIEIPTPIRNEEAFILHYFLHAIISSMNALSVLVDVDNILRVTLHGDKRRLPAHLYPDVLRVLENTDIGRRTRGTMYVLIGAQNKFEKGSMTESTAVLSIPQSLQEIAVSRSDVFVPSASSTPASAPVSPAAAASISKRVVTGYEAGAYVQFLRARREDPSLTYKEFLAKHSRKK